MRYGKFLKAINRLLYIGSAVILIAGTFLTSTTQPVAACNITICHWDNGQGGRWGSITPNENSIASANSWAQSGHGGHAYDAWPAFTASNGDLIPAQGDQSVVQNGCSCPAGTTLGFDNSGAPVCKVSGCTNSLANNYNANAVVDDGSCLFNLCVVPGYTSHQNISYASFQSFMTSNPTSFVITVQHPCVVPPVLGCMDSTATNYNSLATQDNGSCLYNLCVVPGYDSQTGINHTTLLSLLGLNPASFLITDQKPCEIPPVLGCTDEDAINFTPSAVRDDGSCLYNLCVVPGYTTQSNINYATFQSWLSSNPTSFLVTTAAPCVVPPVLGCMDNTATNYNSLATKDDGSCLYNLCVVPGYTSQTGINHTSLLSLMTSNPTSFLITANAPCVVPPVLGCTDDSATNFNSLATKDDGTCLYNLCVVPGYTSQTGISYASFQSFMTSNPTSFLYTENTPCVVPPVLGCMDTAATNYNALATQDDGSCVYSVCVVPAYTISTGLTLANANTLIGNNVGSFSLTDPALCVAPSGCTNPAATNYNPNAIKDDGSCTLPPPGFVLGPLSFLDPFCKADGTVQWTVENPNSVNINVLYWTLDGGPNRAGFTAAPGSNPIAAIAAGTHTVLVSFGESQTIKLTSTNVCGTGGAFLIPVTGGSSTPAPLPVPVTGGAGGGGLIIPVTGADQTGQFGTGFVFAGISLLGLALMMSGLRKHLGL